jgi:hypothetical protein
MTVREPPRRMRLACGHTRPCGCPEAGPCCLNPPCPLEVCTLDVGLATQQAMARNQRIATWRQSGLSRRQVMERLGVTKIMVRRAEEASDV